MRRLASTLYITTPGLYLSLDGENIVIQNQGQEIKRIPLHNLEGVITCGYTGVSPALMGKCAEDGIALTFLSMHGRFLARVTGEEQGNVTLRKTQYRQSDNDEESLRLAKMFLLGKFYNSRWVLERAARDYALRLDVKKLKRASSFLENAIRRLQTVHSADELRGVEGEAAAQYFGVMDDLILQQKEDFYFCGRNKRPPLDNVNALLSFCYTLLAHDCASALETVGLDPYVGYLHRDRPGRISLALDLMEEMRAVVADRFVLTLINKRQVKPDGFIQKENGAVIMTDTARRTVLDAWHKHSQETLTHPFLAEKIPWGLVPYSQALLLARYLRGDLDAYPPFLWK